MTTTIYTVAYPHPKISRGKTILPFTANLEFDGFTLIEQLRVRYPDHCNDLKDASLWKVSRSSVAHPPR